MNALIERDEIFDEDDFYMLMALKQARTAIKFDEVPVGAVIVKSTSDGSSLSDRVLSLGYNQTLTSCDPSAHAEMVAIRQASHQVENHRLVDTTLYVTIEPCLMCVGAIIQARIERVVIGALEPRAGAVISHPYNSVHDCYNHRFSLRSGVMENACGLLMRDFFLNKRKKLLL